MSMIKDILERGGFVENKTYKEVRFMQAPRVTYCIYTDSYTDRGSDDLICLRDHDYVIELYSYSPDEASITKLEKALKYYDMDFTRDPTYWLEDEGVYQSTFTFKHLEKLRGGSSNG